MLIREKYQFPPELYYDRATHVWVRLEGQIAVIGLDALAVDSFGDIAYLSLTEKGAGVERGKSLGTIEAAKMVDDLLAPVSGIVETLNELVLRDPGLVSSDPYGEGGLVRLTITQEAWQQAAADMISGDMLREWAEAEVERLGE
jgi:glycine cleavage system H protein